MHNTPANIVSIIIGRDNEQYERYDFKGKSGKAKGHEKIQYILITRKYPVENCELNYTPKTERAFFILIFFQMRAKESRPV